MGLWLKKKKNKIMQKALIRILKKMMNKLSTARVRTPRAQFKISETGKIWVPMRYSNQKVSQALTTSWKYKFTKTETV
jgi:hypothetical protein